MYVPLRDESHPLQIKIPWDKNTARGFFAALVITFLMLLISPVWDYLAPPIPVTDRINTIPLELINFGEGDGTGISKGNLAEEGRAHKGKEPMSEMHDAEVAAKTKYNQDAVSADPDEASDFVPKSELSSDRKNDKDAGSGTRDVGTKDGTADGSGLGDKGSGPGLGQGIGPIDWGGGGNRTVLYKKLPQYPKGVNTSAEIKIRFTVSRDGTVISMVPLQKGDPALEQAAMKALKQWRFNPLQDDKTMYGIITFTFRLS